MTRSTVQTVARACAWASVVVMLGTICAAARAQWVSQSEQAAFRKLWPDDVQFPVGMWAYKPTEHSQRIAVTNGAPSNSLYHKNRDDVWANAPASINPNHIFPWAVPGGLERSKGWQHFTAIALPSMVYTRSASVPIKNGGNLPGKVWSFPDGTVTADLLTHNGKAFELRTREKVGGAWLSRVPFRELASAPAGYTGPGKRCSECHDHAGTSLQYGITLRGKDTVFSFSPFDFQE